MGAICFVRLVWARLYSPRKHILCDARCLIGLGMLVYSSIAYIVRYENARLKCLGEDGSMHVNTISRCDARFDRSDHSKRLAHRRPANPRGARAAKGGQERTREARVMSRMWPGLRKERRMNFWSSLPAYLLSWLQPCTLFAHR